MACTKNDSVRRPVGIFHYKVCYPGVDAAGGDLTKVSGAWVEVLEPGACDYKRVAWVPFPEQFVSIPVYRDGQYAARHVVLGACSESDPSDSVPFSVDLTPPAKPDKGEVVVPCPQGM